MTVPHVSISQLDGAIGVLSPGGRVLAIVGVSSKGPLNVPAMFARTQDVIAAFGTGPLVEAACHVIDRYRLPVLLVRAAQTTAGDYGTIDDDGVTGTAKSEITETAATEPLDDYDVIVRVVTGGTLGTAGITYQTSLDGGHTWGPVTALGTSLTIAIAGSGVSFDLTTAKTLVAGDFWSCRTSAPLWDGEDLGTALTALGSTQADWDGCHIVGDIDATAFDAIELAFAGMAADAEYHWWIGNVRMPDVGEDEATYFASISGAFGAKASTYGALCYGADLLTSSVSGRKYRRPVSFVAAGREISLSEEQNSADVKLGSLVGVSIRDSNGNPVEGLHDEALNPGADDARFYTLRSWKRRAGVYVNQPRLFSAQGSDFQLLPHRRVMNIALEVLHDFFVERLNSPILVDATTGFILESEAVEIETAANALLRAALLDKPKASDAFCVVSRTDNLLSTATLNGEARVVPLAYPTKVALSVGFSNPALQVQAV